jgi:type IV secretion system protein TrbJ
MHKRIPLAVGLAIAVVIVPPRQAKAQFGPGVFVCTNCSDEGTTLVMKAQQAMQYLKEAQTALRAIQMATMMAREGEMLVRHPSTNIMADLAMLSTIMVQSQGLAGTMAQLDTQFRQTYGNTGYVGPDGITTYASKYNNWASTTLKTINGSLNSAGYQSGMLQNEQMWMAQIQAMNQMPLGRDQSLQLGNTIATEEVAQLQSLRQLMIADMESRAAFSAQQVNTQQTQQNAQQSGFTYVQPVTDSRVW